MKQADYLIIGAGIVGLACAYELRKRFPNAKITILEKEPQPGLHASGRNSGVLHSGIYYKSDSLKARVCTRGARMMRTFARENKIPILERGKLIVATGEKDLGAIARLMQNAKANGVQAELLDEEGVRRYEPHAKAFRQGIFIQDTAVIDSRELVRKLAEILNNQGVGIQTGQEVCSISPEKKEVHAAGERYAYGFLINCAGAYADTIARFFETGRDYCLVPFKGIYYKLKPERSSLVRSNIYPVPREGFPFLGIHFTRHPAGDVYAGPTAIPVLGRENYGVFQGINLRECSQILFSLMRMYFSKNPGFRNLAHEEMAYYWKPRFVRQAQRLVPSLYSGDLLACAKVGIRPQLIHRRTGQLEMDYVIEKTGSSLHVLNAVSPALTSAFAFAEVLADKLGNN